MSQRKNEAVWVEKRQHWRIDVQKDGERKSFYSTMPDKKGKIEAEKIADRWIVTRKNENIRFGRLWTDFLEEIKLTTSEGNYRQHEQMGRLWLLPKLEHKKIIAITPQDLQDCIYAAYKKGLSKKSCQNIKGSITAVCRYGLKRGIETPRLDSITIPKNTTSKEKKILQPDDIKLIFNIDYVTKYGKKEPAFFIHAWRFCILTGLRRSELCNLKKADIKDNILHVRGTKTKSADRYIALSSWMQKVLLDQQQMLKASGIISPYIFPDEHGEKLEPGHLYEKWSTFRKQNNISCSLHEMRHTLISVTKSDMPKELLKLLVGHTSNTDTFGIYGHEVEGDLLRTANILDDVFNRLLK